MKPALTALAALAALLVARQGLAFCRARTCNRSAPEQRCEVDSRDCVVSGHELFWPSDCVRIGINEAGSIRHGISFEQLRDATEAAFQTWANASCSGGLPSLRIEVVGPIPCDQSEYNRGAGNINLVVFRDENWPYAGAVDVLGITRVRFNADTGEIWDADIEINGTAGSIVSDGSGEVDLQSVLTHEAGHVLGLDHSDLIGSTMIAGYDARDTTLRTLEFDDVEGICAIFPPGAGTSGSCEPRGGFSEQCGGSIDPAAPPPSENDDGCGLATTPPRGWAGPLTAVIGVTVWAARRRRKRHYGTAAR